MIEWMNIYIYIYYIHIFTYQFGGADGRNNTIKHTSHSQHHAPLLWMLLYQPLLYHLCLSSPISLNIRWLTYIPTHYPLNVYVSQPIPPCSAYRLTFRVSVGLWPHMCRYTYIYLYIYILYIYIYIYHVAYVSTYISPGISRYMFYIYKIYI